MDTETTHRTEPPLLANGVHHLPEQVLIGKSLGLPPVAGAFDDLPAETLDLVCCHLAKVRVEQFPGLDLLAVDEQRVRTGQRDAAVVEVAEERQPALRKGRDAVLLLTVEPRDVVVNQLGRGRIVAHHDEARRNPDVCFLPETKDLLVVAVEGVQRGQQFGRQAQRVQGLGLAASPLGHLLPDMLPQVAELGHVLARYVVRHRHPGKFHDAALDGVHQREVAHGPGKEGPLRVARPAQEERRRGKVQHPVDAELPAHRLQSRNPQPGGLAVLLRFLLFLGRQGALLPLSPIPALRLLAIAVVRLVVDRQDVPDPHQLGHDPLQHLPLGLQGPRRLSPSLEQGTAAPGQIHAFALLEGVVVGDDDPRPGQVREHVRGDQFPAPVVTVRVVGLEHSQPVLDGEAGRDHQEAAGEPAALGPTDRVDGLPSDQHGHDGGLAGARGQLEGEPLQLRVGVVVGAGQMVEKPPAGLARVRRHLGEPDDGLYRFDLAEERTDVAESVAPPVLQQPSSLRRHLPPARVRDVAPPVHLSTNGVDEGRMLVPLSLGGKAPAFVEQDRGLLFRLSPFLPGLWNGRDELGGPSTPDDLLGRLPVLVQLPMARRVLVRRVEHGLVEERMGQDDTSRRFAMGSPEP